MKKIVIDIEANALFSPSEIWVIVCVDLMTGKRDIFREVTSNVSEAERFRNFATDVDLWIGHNILGYDLPHIDRLLGMSICNPDHVVDTFICSKLIDYPRERHSIENYGEEFNYPKIEWHDYSKYSLELETYCIRDVEISLKIYKKYQRYIENPDHHKSIRLEHSFQIIVNELSINGFTLDTTLASRLLTRVTKELSSLDKDILEVFIPKLKLLREVIPKATKYGTISLSSIPKSLRDSISDYNVDAPFSYCHWVEFNPASHKQIIEVLNDAGWEPTDKTKAHIQTERELNKLKRLRRRSTEIDLEIQRCHTALDKLRLVGWKVNENNLSTLPISAPAPARLLAKRILHEARRRTLTEWLSLVQDDGRVHGQFQGIGAWTHRMSHQKPNMANITNEFDLAGNVKLLGKELRQCWTVPKNKLLVGVDAEGIQLRIFAHYINDEEFTHALVHGDKSKKTDPHNLNKSVLGSVCKSRDAAKRFIFAMLLGAGLGKLSEILECSNIDCEKALERLLQRYAGFAKLKQEVVPADAERGWFNGVDGRRVRIHGETVGLRRHHAMSGYLQNGEVVVMKTAAVIANPLIKPYDSFFINIVHDEDQVETPNDFKIAVKVAEILNDSIREAGERLKLLCPLAGSFWSDKRNDYTIGRNWYQTH